MCVKTHHKPNKGSNKGRKNRPHIWKVRNRIPCMPGFPKINKGSQKSVRERRDGYSKKCMKLINR